jgi:hypothetical protein
MGVKYPPPLAKQINLTKRAAVAVMIVAFWIAGIALLLRRNANQSEAQRLAEVALRIQPATFYYIVERDGQQIGAASSSLDTTATTLVAEEYFVGDYPAPGGKPDERTSARWQTRLTRGFRLVALTIDIARPTRPFSMSASVAEDTTLIIGTKRQGRRLPARYNFTPPLYTPSLSPIVFMLGGSHATGRKQALSVVDPTTRTVIRPELTIRAESVFTVVDSAAFYSTGWAAAHRDTVRAWRIDGAPHGLTAWVDAEGRVVSARLGSLSATRTAFEIAFKSSKAK